MFDNVGGKIKAVAKIFCWIGIIASVIGGIGCFVMAAEASRSMQMTLILSGIGAIVGGSLVSWLGSLFTYGFGELIDQVTLFNSRR